MHAAALLLQVDPSDVARFLRADALGLGLGTLQMALGLLALGLYWGSPLRREPALPWFGVSSFVYGLRLLARTTTVPLAFGLPDGFPFYLAAALTYVMPLPMVLFLRMLYPGWRRLLTWSGAGLGAFAIGALASDLVSGQPYSASTPNNLIAIAFMATALVLAFRSRSPVGRDERTLRVGLLSLAVTALVDNLRGLQVLRWPGFEVEPLGATVLIACLGVVAARRAVGNRERLYALDRELALARRIQSSILPSAMPWVPGLTVGARYEPMTAVAGDFYDFLEAREGGLGVLVADVSGHGVPAALIASMVKVATAAQRSRADHPAEVLAGLNEALAGQLGGQYVTAAYLFLDRERGVMRYGAAGHPPILRWRADESVQELMENGLPLGLMEVAAYGEIEQPLRPGDRFLLYTDGLVEAADAGGEFLGLDRVREEVVHGARLPATALADRLASRVGAWSNGNAGDDVTIVVVDCHDGALESS
jgi:phosphoserine phosphatase RsbU/P